MKIQPKIIRSVDPTWPRYGVISDGDTVWVKTLKQAKRICKAKGGQP